MSDTKDNELGKLVRQQRVAAGLSLEDLERAAHVDKSTLSRIENGLISSPRLELLQRVAGALGGEVEDYLALLGYPTSMLPQFGIYLRTKYGVDADTAEEMQHYFDFIRNRHRPGIASDEPDEAA